MKKKTNKTKTKDSRIPMFSDKKWGNPKLPPPPLEDIDDSGKFLTYDDLVETGVDFIIEDINILEEQLTILDQTSNQLLDCLHMKLPPKLVLKNGSKYDSHRDFTVSVISKVKQIKKICNQLTKDSKNFGKR